MTEEQIARELEARGCPEHVVRGGRQGLIARWGAFVREVERGYELGIEDYQNDLDIRTLIEDLGLADAPEVSDADERMKQSLVRTEIKLWGGPENAFWIYGRPRDVGDDLRQDLEARDWL